MGVTGDSAAGAFAPMMMSQSNIDTSPRLPKTCTSWSAMCAHAGTTRFAKLSLT